MSVIFDLINDLSYNKKNILTDENIKEYNPRMINRFFSFFPETVLYSNEMNLLPQLYKDEHYQFYMNIIRKNKRFTKWPKKNKSREDELNAIQKYYGYNLSRAREVLKLLSKEQLEHLVEIMNPE